MKRDEKNLSSGVTLIELLVSMAVLAVLIAGILTVIDPLTQIKKARDAQRKSDLSQIQKALEQYYQDQGRYPPAEIPLAPHGNRIQKLDGTYADWGTSFSPYISILPKDPGGTGGTRYYAYGDASNGQAYYLYASLERGGRDPQACSPTGAVCSNADAEVGIEGCGELKVCNYGVTSPNVSP